MKNLRCLNPRCRRFLCEADVTGAASLRLPCSTCGGQSTYIFDDAGHVCGKTHMARRRGDLEGTGITREDIRDRRENKPPSKIYSTLPQSRLVR